MIAASVLSTLLLILAATAHPVEQAGSLARLSFTKRIIDEVFNIVEHDLQRVKFIQGIDIFGLNSPAVNKAVAYVASVGVGSPPTNYDLIIDTGSSNTWIGAGKPYVKTYTSHETSNSMSLIYGAAAVNGTEFIDQVTISPDLVIPDQSIGVAIKAENFTTVDGIMGVGPTNLTYGTLSPDKKAIIPTVTDNLYAECKTHVPVAVLGVSFEPITTDNATAGQINGELTWGGVDYTKFIGAITYVPITTTPLASTYWGIDASVSYGNIPLLPASAAGIVDTGTTLVLLATDAFNIYKEATGGVIDEVTTLIKITPDQYARLKSFIVIVGGVPFELIPNAQIWPRKLNAALGGTAGAIYLIIGDLGTQSGDGLDFYFGQVFLERHYSVYDTTNSRVGLGKTPYTYAITN